MFSYLIGILVLLDSPIIFMTGFSLLILCLLYVFGRSEETLKRFFIALFGVLLGMALSFHASAEMQDDVLGNGEFEVYGYAYGPEYGNTGKLVLKVEGINDADGYRDANAAILILADADLSEYRHGYVKYKGSLYDESKPKNPNEFDYRLYGLFKGYDKVSFFDESSVIEKVPVEGSFDPVAIKDEILAKSEIIIEGKSRAYFASLVFGDTSLLSEEQEQQIGMSGLSHLFAVSGLHIAILYGFLLKLLDFFHMKNRWVKYAAVLSIVAGFISITGFPVSAVRAFLFITVLALSKIAKRKYDLLNSLLIAAMIVLTLNPYQIYSPGFQLSFGAVASIHFIYPAIRKWNGSQNMAVKAFLISLAVQIGIAPILIWHFNYISIVSIIANVPAIILMGIWQPVLYIFAIAVHFSIPFVPGALALPIDLAMAGLNWFSGEAAGLSWAYVELPSMGPKAVGIYYCTCILFVLQSRKDVLFYADRMKRAAAVIMAVLVIAAVPSIAIGKERIEIIFFDVGQGDCMLLKTKNDRKILVDSGSGDKNIDDILLKNGIGSIDLAVLTHFHEDHYGGFMELAEKGRIDTMLLKERAWENQNIKNDLEAKMEANGNSVIYAKEGQSIEMDGLTIEVLNVCKSQEESDSHATENDDSIVLLLDYRNFELLLTGDIESETEKRLASENTEDIDLIKASHHGSKTSNTEVFLESFKPETAVIQVGKNFFGHPAPSVIDRYGAFGIDIYRTDNDGAISIETDGFEKYSINSFFSNRSEEYGLE
ncbi:MAG: DNA internalization-related competence protein ComEC/Rec2 [Clostridiales bacterium]|nr:MAG: DNA internalization-related competence protein ComEC/Rec2 [Clostridiales bacterium]